MRKEEILKLLPIETERMRLRVATLNDNYLIQEAKESCDADVLRRWMSWSSDEGMSMLGTVNYLNMVCAPNNKRNIALLGVDKWTGEHILSTGLDAEDDDFQTVSTGWWLSGANQGKGLAYEGMNALIQFCRDHNICKKLTSCHYEGNERSQKLMQRLGFQFLLHEEKAWRCHLDGKYHDVLNYELAIGQQ
jgi:RimJ/RimL family protein N-acetyltransferase